MKFVEWGRSQRCLWTTLRTLALAVNDIGNHWGILEQRRAMIQLNFKGVILVTVFRVDWESKNKGRKTRLEPVRLIKGGDRWLGPGCISGGSKNWLDSGYILKDRIVLHIGYGIWEEWRKISAFVALITERMDQLRAGDAGIGAWVGHTMFEMPVFHEWSKWEGIWIWKPGVHAEKDWLVL